MDFSAGLVIPSQPGIMNDVFSYIHCHLSMFNEREREKGRTKVKIWWWWWNVLLLFSCSKINLNLLCYLPKKWDTPCNVVIDCSSYKWLYLQRNCENSVAIMWSASCDQVQNQPCSYLVKGGVSKKKTEKEKVYRMKMRLLYVHVSSMNEAER